MKRIAKFHKVSKERFTADWIDTFAQSQEEAEKVYEAIRLPKRATAGSAGYDFFAPAEFTLKPGETVKIPTGIRNCKVSRFSNQSGTSGKNLADP